MALRRSLQVPKRLAALVSLPGLLLGVDPAGAAPDSAGSAKVAPSDTNVSVGAPSASTGGAVDDLGTNEPSAAGMQPDHGFEHGLRLGAVLPLGKTDAGNPLRDSGDLSGIVGVRVPIWLDLGYRLDRSLWLGIAAQLGLGTVGSDCTDDQECEWSDLGLAAQATLALDPASSVDPWLGVGLGWEWLRGSVTLTVPGEPLGLDQDVAVRLHELLGGPQLFAQGGLRFDLGESLTVGPYATAALGMYLTDSFDCPEEASCPESGSVNDEKIHAWLGIGLRGTHGP